MTDAPTISKEEALADFRLLCKSRHASLMGRKEVFMGKAKFGIFGDGKELAQIALAKVFRNGDFRSGYYRDQTLMMAINQLTLQQYFAQLYAHTDVEAEPASAGRMMNGHFGSRTLDEQGRWKNLTAQKNSSSDTSPTASQMLRLLGLAFASKLFRQNEALHTYTQFSNKGNEIAFGTIGDASTSEGLFFESLNAAGVLQVPMLMSVWDDGYGISVPQKYQTTKSNISEILKGLQRTETEPGFEIFRVKGWDYEALCKTYERAEAVCRKEHVPVLVHVTEVTQPQGHSTSGSHERYKSKERMTFEAGYDCLRQMRLWLLKNRYATEEELNSIEQQATDDAREAKNAAWKAFVASMQADHQEAIRLLNSVAASGSAESAKLTALAQELSATLNPIRQDAIKAAKKALRLMRFEDNGAKRALNDWLERILAENKVRYSSHLYSESAESALKVSENKASYASDAVMVDGREILQACFDNIFNREPLAVAFGEDVGFLGDVNQAFAGLQAKYGEIRIMDTGIREASIIGQGIGAAMRGLRPIAEIQYLDYLLYALQILSDDLATLQYRTKGGQKAPLIIRSRGHRLEGIWHSGSPMGAILSTMRGVYVLVPRNMTQAAGFYNTMLKSDDTAIIIECLNGYRLKETMPQNIGEFTVPLGQPEILRKGKDVTVVTYGSMCRIVLDAAEQLEEVGISVEVIDVQTLLPFDLNHSIVKSIQKTNRVIFADEDVSGGASAYMMQKVLDEQDAYRWLDAKPICVSGKDHRPPYASDGDYFSKPSTEDIYDAVYEMLSEAFPKDYPELYK